MVIGGTAIAGSGLGSGATTIQTQVLMTLLNMFEIVHVEFPKRGETYIKALLQNSYKEFCMDTLILRKSYGLVLETDSLTYTKKTSAELAALSGAAIIYGSSSVIDGKTLPTDIHEVYRVDYYGAEMKPLDQNLFPKWWMEHGNIWFGDENTVEMPGEVKAVVIHYIAVPDSLTDATEPSIPVAFHEAIYTRVLAQFAALDGKNQFAQMMEARWTKLRHEGKKYANKMQDSGIGQVQQEQF